MLGDGCWKKGKKGVTGTYHSISKRLANDVAEISLKCGYGISLRNRVPSVGKINGNFPVNLVFLTKYALSPRCGKPTIISNFKGWVSCVRVSSGVIFVERNGKTCWSGNSCDKCDINNPYVNPKSAEGHPHPTVPLKTDDEWVKEHAFYFTQDGRLMPRRSAEPVYLAGQQTDMQKEAATPDGMVLAEQEALDEISGVK